MVYVGVFNQPRLEPGVDNPYAHVNVLTKTHCREPGRAFEHLYRKPHIEAPRMKLIQFLATSTNATGGEKRRHRIVYGPLQESEVLLRFVRSAERVGIVRVEGVP